MPSRLLIPLGALLALTVLGAAAFVLLEGMSAVAEPADPHPRPAESEAGARRLRLAGADQVISAYQTGGTRIAASILRPAVVDFLEFSTLGLAEDVALEEIQVGAGCAMAGRMVGDLEEGSPRLRIVALKRGGEPTRITPDVSMAVAAGDYLVVIGERSSLERLAQLAQAG